MEQERPAKGYVVAASEGLTGQGSGILATRESTRAALTVMESQIDGGPPLHVHKHEDESFYVLEGAVTVRCGGDVFEAGPRSFVFLPRLVPHAFRSIGGPVTLLLIAVPGGIEDYFRDLHQAAEDSQVRRVQAKYGITVL
jgi:mannose-6-phosphate isomerase-like protein (cupin superfamily)